MSDVPEYFDAGDVEDELSEDGHGPQYRATANGLSVTMPSGALFPVSNQIEVDFLISRADRYQEQNRFHNISDLADLDRLLIQELLSFRWAYFLSTGTDYHGEEINDAQLRKSVNDYSVEIRRLKDQLGIDKTSRDRARGEDSVSEYVLRLGIRAREFGIHRDEQAAMVIELGQQLIALMTYYDNMDDVERREAGLTKDDFFEWIRTTFRTEFERLDIEFRKNQKMWVRDI
jgi:hypothetical protein